MNRNRKHTRRDFWGIAGKRADRKRGDLWKRVSGQFPSWRGRAAGAWANLRDRAAGIWEDLRDRAADFQEERAMRRQDVSPVTHRRHVSFGIICLIAGLFLLLCLFPLRSVLDIAAIRMLKENLDFIGTFLFRYPWLATVAVILLVQSLLMGKFSLNSTTVSVMGLELQLRQTENAVKAHVRNFLSTKRAVFVFYPEYDNHYDCINSMYQVFTFLGEQLTYFDNFSQTGNDSYIHIEGMIQEIGRFLTKYQSDYRRFYEMKLREYEGDFVPFQDIQHEYGKTLEMTADFQELNRDMEEHARFFHIDTEKWTHWYDEGGFAEYGDDAAYAEYEEYGEYGSDADDANDADDAFRATARAEDGERV